MKPNPRGVAASPQGMGPDLNEEECQMNADRQITIDRRYDVIDDVQTCIPCLFPAEGEESLADLTEKCGDDLDAIMQSATYYLIAEDGRYFALESWGRFCFIGSSDGVHLMREGDRYEDPNGDDLVATANGWKPVAED